MTVVKSAPGTYAYEARETGRALDVTIEMGIARMYRYRSDAL